FPQTHSLMSYFISKTQLVANIIKFAACQLRCFDCLIEINLYEWRRRHHMVGHELTTQCRNIKTSAIVVANCISFVKIIPCSFKHLLFAICMYGMECILLLFFHFALKQRV